MLLKKNLIKVVEIIFIFKIFKIKGKKKQVYQYLLKKTMK